MIVENSLKKTQTTFTMKVSLSRDLLLFLAKQSIQSNPRYLYSLFEVYEFFCSLQTTNTSHSLIYLQTLLIELVEFHASQSDSNVKTLEDHFVQNKFYESYSLIAEQVVAKQYETVLSSSLKKLTDFHTEFCTFIEGNKFKDNGS